MLPPLVKELLSDDFKQYMLFAPEDQSEGDDRKESLNIYKS